jgi:hypothetical protein
MTVQIDDLSTEVTPTDTSPAAATTQSEPAPPGGPEAAARELARRVARDHERTRAEGFHD